MPSLAIPGIVIILTMAVVALLPLDGKRGDYLGLAYLLFFPFLALLGIGLMSSIACFFEAIEKKNAVALSILLLLVYSIPFLAMFRNFF